MALLIDPQVAVGVKRARLLAAEHRFEYVRRVVAMFWDRLQARTVQAGKVITALDDRWGAPELDERFRSTDFYRRHRTPAEVAAEEEAAWEPEPPDEEPPPADAPPGEDLPTELAAAASAWRQLQTELSIEQGGSFDRWLHDTWVIAYEESDAGCGFLIGLPDAFRYDWIVHRLSRQLKRKLSVILGRTQVDVEFRVQPRPQMPPVAPTSSTNGSNP